MTFLPQQNCHFFYTALTALSAQHRVNQNKQNGQTFCEKVKLTKILIDWREVLTKPITKIVVPNQFLGLLLYVDKLARVLATWVKNLQ